MKLLFVLTFVFGVVKLLTHTKLFDSKLTTPFDALLGVDANSSKNNVLLKLLAVLDVWFFYFSLCYQAWYWLIK